ncbi:hypothetical protein EV426DRAFT_576945 [Tirmania nivea]|nr:hypothetical protein EV426DRAFT_576945 [Tirmania nivea]
MPQSNLTLAMVQAFVAPEDEEIVDNEEELEERILATYESVPDEDSDDDEQPEPASIPRHQALAALETLTLYGLQSGPLNEAAYQFYYRECRRIEAAQLADKRTGKQTVITAFFTSSGAVPGSPVPSSSSTSR